MSLIIILLALLVERMAAFIHPIRAHHWFECYAQKIHFMVKNKAYLSFFLIILPMLLLIFFVHMMLLRFSFGWGSWIFDLLVLVYCLGDTHLRAQIRECYAHIESGDVDAARVLLLEHFDMDEKGAITFYVLMKAFYRASLQRVFALLFWFIILGPTGAVFYRFTQKLSVAYEHDSLLKLHAFAEKITFVFDWVPARLLALSFCLAGHFTDIFTKWRDAFKTGLKDTYQVLYSCGHTAIQPYEDPESSIAFAQFDEAYYLVCRSLFIWLVVLALIILF